MQQSKQSHTCYNNVYIRLYPAAELFVFLFLSYTTYPDEMSGRYEKVNTISLIHISRHLRKGMLMLR